MLSQKIFANIYYPKITPMVLSETKLFLGGNMLIFIIIINIFTIPPNLPLSALRFFSLLRLGITSKLVLRSP